MGRQQSLNIQLTIDPKRKLALREAFQTALAGQAAHWKAIVRAALIYETPSFGSWWWSVTLSSAAGAQHMLLVPPGDQTPKFIADMVAKAISGDLPTVLCAGCKKVRLKSGSWHVRPLPKGRPHVTHGLCPDCVRRLYPSLKRGPR